MEEMPMNIDHKKPENRPLYIFALIAVVVILFLNIFAIPAMQERSVEKTDYSTFLSNVERGNVSKAEVQDDYIYYIVRKNGEDVVCKTVRMDDPDLVSRLYEAGTSMEAVEPQKQSILLSLVIGYVIPIVIFVFLGRWLSKKMMSSMGGGPGGAMSFGKSNAKVYVKSSTGIKFTDVAGEDEAKELLTEIVDYLHNPQKMVNGEVKAPRMELVNEELFRTHLHSTILSLCPIRQLSDGISALVDYSNLNSIPLKEDVKIHLELSAELKQAIKEVFNNAISDTFLNGKLEEEKPHWFNDNWIDRVLDAYEHDFSHALDRWRALYREAQKQIEEAQHIIKNKIYADNSKEKLDALMKERRATNQRDMLLG